MRRSTLWSVMLAASLAACGSDGGGDDQPNDEGEGTKQDTDDVANGNDDGDDEVPDGDSQALCALAEGGGLPAFDGARVWSGDDFLACQDACPNFDTACVTASCAAGFEAFDACVATEVNACLTALNGPCRNQFEAHLCCADEKCEIDTDPNAAECVAAECPDTREGFIACGDDSGVETCIGPAVARCITEPPSEAAAGEATSSEGVSLPSELSRTLSIRASHVLRVLDVQSPSSGSAE
jgi:hypothetical protein